MAALQALVNSLSPEIFGTSKDGDKLTPEQIKQLSDKMDEIIGTDGPSSVGQNSSERGEVRPFLTPCKDDSL